MGLASPSKIEEVTVVLDERKKNTREKGGGGALQSYSGVEPVCVRLQGYPYFFLFWFEIWFIEETNGPTWNRRQQIQAKQNEPKATL